jgi:SAM-dependent methyltransferase
MTEYALRLSEPEVLRYKAMAVSARESEGDLWTQTGIVGGAHVADIGCGPGAMLPALAELVGSTGRVVGVDRDDQAVAMAQALVAELGLSNVSVMRGSAEATGLDPASFDVVMMRHVLAHNGRTEQAIVDHAASLVRPRGCVYLVDGNGPALFMRGLDADLADMSEKYLQFHARRGNDLRTGLRLDLLAEAAGLETVAYRGWIGITTIPANAGGGPAWAAREAMLADGVITEADILRWERAQQRQAAEGRALTVFPSVFALCARRPS